MSGSKHAKKAKGAAQVEASPGDKPELLRKWKQGTSAFNIFTSQTFRKAKDLGTEDGEKLTMAKVAYLWKTAESDERDWCQAKADSLNAADAHWISKVNLANAADAHQHRICEKVTGICEAASEAAYERLGEAISSSSSSQ